MKTKKIIIILSLIISNIIFAQTKMPGEYTSNEELDKIFKELDFRGDLKSGSYELYNVVSRTLEVDEIKFSIFDDDSKVLKWLEINVKTFDSGNIVSKVLTDKGLLQGKLKRVQIKYSKYYPFEIDLTKNKSLKKRLTKNLVKGKEKEILKDRKFVKDSTIKISGKTYKIKVYEIKNKNNDIEYAILSDEDTKLLGLAYLKNKKGVSLYLKELGNNSLSIFPKEVPMLDFMSKISQMSESFIQYRERKEKALKRERELEKEDKNDLKDDDPIKKLNKMLEKEGQ